MLARLSSLRLRLVLLVLLALLPAAAVIYYSAADRRADSGDRVRTQTLQLATNAAADYNRSVESTREFLLPIGQLLGLLSNLNEEVKKGQLQVRQYKDMLTVEVAEQLFFDSGKAALKDTGKEVLKKVGEALKGYDDKMVRVVGHTDNVPIATAQFPSNWELSAARATTVVRFLQANGVPPERLTASGRGEFSPIAPNDDAEGRRKNRRIEITLIDKNLAQEVQEKR